MVSKKASSKKAAPKRKAAAEPVKPVDLGDLRTTAQTADIEVQRCIRALNRAKSTTADFTVRNHNIKVATEDIVYARSQAEEAWAALDTAKRTA